MDIAEARRGPSRYGDARTGARRLGRAAFSLQREVERVGSAIGNRARQDLLHTQRHIHGSRLILVGERRGRRFHGDDGARQICGGGSHKAPAVGQVLLTHGVDRARRQIPDGPGLSAVDLERCLTVRKCNRCRHGAGSPGNSQREGTADTRTVLGKGYVNCERRRLVSGGDPLGNLEASGGRRVREFRVRNRVVCCDSCVIGLRYQNISSRGTLGNRIGRADRQVIEANHLARLQANGHRSVGYRSTPIRGILTPGIACCEMIVMEYRTVLHRTAVHSQGEGKREDGFRIPGSHDLLDLQPTEPAVGEARRRVAGSGRGDRHGAVRGFGNDIALAAALHQAIDDGIAVAIRTGKTREEIADGPRRGLPRGDGNGAGLVDRGIVTDVQIEGEGVAGRDRAYPALLHIDREARQVVFQREAAGTGALVPPHGDRGISLLIGAVRLRSTDCAKL